MHRWLFKALERIFALILVVVATIVGVRAFDAWRGPPLDLWHTYVPKELSVAEMDAGDWAGYLKAEEAVEAGIRREVTDKLPEVDRVATNRYFDASPLYPGRFRQDWNRSYELDPAGTPVGVVVLLHGLTDSPYSLRHVAEDYRDHGYVAVGIRLPGHGTVPGGLTAVQWEDWMAATRLAVREARRRVPAPAPLHIVGYSNGGALAMMYALDAVEDPKLARPDRVVLFSPMIGVTRFARFSGLAGLPALLPAFAEAAWLDRLPEFNPFKYNSFPVNAARQSFLLSDRLQERIASLAGGGRLGSLAPVLTFQSVVDNTVSTRAVVNALYDHLPANGSELVLFDVNRSSRVAPILSAAADEAAERILPPRARLYRVEVIGDTSATDSQAVARIAEAGEAERRAVPIGLVYPADVYSLSHIAMPFPTRDSLYGTDPDEPDNFGIHLGTMLARGERGQLIIGLDTLLRMSSNPFFPYVLQRIEAGMPPSAATPTPPAPPASAPEVEAPAPPEATAEPRPAEGP